MLKIKWKIIVLSILLLSLTIVFLILLYKGFYFSSICLFLFCLFILYEIISTIYNILNATEQIISGIANQDYSLKLSNKKIPDSIHQPLLRIVEHQKKQNQDNHSIKIIYENIINSIDTGILILKKNKEHKIEIFYANESFFHLLELPRYTHWHLLAPYLKAFQPFIKIDNWKDYKNIITLSINNKEQDFSFRTFSTFVYNESYLIIHLDTIQNIVDKKEKESWYNLMKVMSHEILNTITPISSLSNNLEYLITERKNELGNDFEDIQKSVFTIQERTQHLSDFVNTYRSLAELPSPQKIQVKIESIIQHSVTTLSILIQENKIIIEKNIHPDATYFFIDKNQIEQVLINLITNSIYALKNIKNPKIIITTYSTNIYNCIEIIDNGIGISNSIKNDIFIPFFTTRENGSGIGLSLSKNIIQAHGGHIHFSSQKNKTSFIIQIPRD